MEPEERAPTFSELTKSLHPLLAETVWLKQNIYEESEANFHKACSYVPPVSQEVGQTKRKKKDKLNAQVEGDKPVSEKPEPWSWLEKLEKRLTTIKNHSQQLENVMNQMQKAQAKTRDLLVHLSSAMDACLNRVTRQDQDNRAHIESVQTLLLSVTSTVGSIKKSMAAKDCKSYKSYEAFCQAMHDRLSVLEEEINYLSLNGGDVYTKSLERNLKEIIAAVNDVHLKMDQRQMKTSKSNVLSSITSMDNILKRSKSQRNNTAKIQKLSGIDSSSKGQRNNTAKIQGLSGINSSTNSMSVESLEDISSLSGECSDFAPDMDDFEGEFLSDQFEEIAKNKKFPKAEPMAQPVGMNSSSSPQKKKNRRCRKKRGVTGNQLQGSNSTGNLNQKVTDSKKAVTVNAPGNVRIKKSTVHADEANQLQRNKSKIFHNRSSKHIQPSSERSPKYVSPLKSANGASSMFSTSSPTNLSHSVDNNPLLCSGITASVTPQLYASSLNTSSGIYADYNQMNAAFMTSNPVLIERHLNEVAQKFQTMHLAAKQTFDLQQMLQETERLRQIAIKTQQRSLLQEQFKQRYEMLLNAFSQYQKVYAYQQSQQQVQASLPKPKTLSKVQPSARFKDMQKGSQPGPKTKDPPKPKKQQSDLRQAVSKLPGVVNVDVQKGPQPGPKTKDPPKPKKQQSDLSQAVSKLPGVGNVDVQKGPQPGPKTKDPPTPKKEQSDLSQAVSKLSEAVNVQSSEMQAKKASFYPHSSSQAVHVASFSPRIHSDRQKAGISSMVVLDNISCILMVDIINSCLKLYNFSISDGTRTHNFKFVTTLDLPNPYYMARLGTNEIIVSRNGCFLSVVQVSAKDLKVISNLEMPTQYYGLTFVVNNTIAAAAYEATKIDLLNINKVGTLHHASSLISIPYGPELLANIPATNDIVYLDRHPDGPVYLKCINLKGEEIFNQLLGKSPINVWNLACVGETILCCNKHKNKLLSFSSSGRRQNTLFRSDLPVDQPFALSFSASGNLFLANDGAWETDGNHYVTTEINVFTFTKQDVSDLSKA